MEQGPKACVSIVLIIIQLKCPLQTATTTIWFMLAMISQPEKQEVPGELDRVVGRSRLPTFRDRPNPPYVCVTVRELLRWRPIAPLGELYLLAIIHCMLTTTDEIGLAHQPIAVTFYVTSGHLTYLIPLTYLLG